MTTSNVLVVSHKATTRIMLVELYADGGMDSAPIRQEMKRLRPPAGSLGGYIYSAVVSAARPPTDYTARVIPRRDGVAIPLEYARILWQR